PADVLELEQHAGREPRERLVVGDLERDRTGAAAKVALHRDRAPVEAKRERHPLAALERPARDRAKPREPRRVVAQRGAALPLPAALLERDKLVEPGLEIAAGLELVVGERA